MTSLDLPPDIATALAAPVGFRVARDVVRATGPDAEKYLQGQLSQDLAPMVPGDAAWSLLLQPQGKINTWLRISKVDDGDFLLDTDQGAGEAMMKRLMRFKLRTDCEFALATWDIVSVRGPGASALALDLPDGALLAADPAWPATEGIDFLGPVVAIPTGLSEGTEATYEALRLLAAVPAMGAELDESTIPAAAGIVDRSVSFTKGCYTGQELVARVDSRGNNVPKRLRRVVVEGPAVVGDDVLVGGESAGSVTSAQRLSSQTIALAYIKRSVEAPASAVVAGAPAQILAPDGPESSA